MITELTKKWKRSVRWNLQGKSVQDLIRNLIKYLPEILGKIMKSPFERVTLSGNKKKIKRKSKKFYLGHSDTKMCLVRGTDTALVYIYLFYISGRFYKNSFLICF